MNEDNGAARRKDEIGIAGEIAPVQPVAESERVNESPDDKLRLGIFRPNERHALTALAF